MSGCRLTITEALCAAWLDGRLPGTHSAKRGVLIVTGPSQDGTAVLGPSSTVAGGLWFGALVPPGVAIEPADRDGFRLVVWHLAEERTVVNLWRERRAQHTQVTLHEAHACLTLWSATLAEVRFVGAFDSLSAADVAATAAAEYAALLGEARALWGPHWRQRR